MIPLSGPALVSDLFYMQQINGGVSGIFSSMERGGLSGLLLSYVFLISVDGSWRIKSRKGAWAPLSWLHLNNAFSGWLSGWSVWL